ncbi:type ISP restriction/modification enzyme [Flammeovirga agarivorans]|uniref:Type ISP restriction-modification enzyme LLaBIII C-terminal specificity domain-containing protein n=1 Tax=Flammeovirga agarivorans TaxID=2726742 RepID=A0A7X8XUN6_9BACT|nr:type ISP restriction/modification enzyme [Flammeovirga agarivorans]NLR90557.1 hypothetical protein [Flammeovirga agarivorans]
MIGEAIQSLQQQLLFGGDFKAEVQTEGEHLIKAFQKSFYATFGVEDLIKIISEHLVGYHVTKALINPENQEALLQDPIFIAFDQLVNHLSDQSFIQQYLTPLSDKINILLSDGSSKSDVFTQLMGREEGEALPNYFMGMFKSLLRKHLNNSGRDAKYLYPSFTLPPFLDNEAASNTMVCYDLLVYYWCAVTIPASDRSFGNSLSFTDIQPQGQKHLEFQDQDSNLNKLVNLNRDPVQIVFGTIQQMSLGNRTAHKFWNNKVKKAFIGDQKRNPVSYWLLWAKERLGNNGILVIRGDQSLAAAPEYTSWRKQVAKICNRVYIQAHQYSNQIVYCFIFEPNDEHEGVFYAPSYLEDFSPISQDSEDWITLSSEEYNTFLCLHSLKEKSIFQESIQPSQIKNRTWFTDFNKPQLLDKLKAYQNEQQKSKVSSLPIHNHILDIDESNVLKVYTKPFTKKWAYIPPVELKAWSTSHDAGFNQINPSICLGAGKDYGFEISLVQHPVLHDFFERKQVSNILPLRVYKEDGSFRENVSDWALNRFKQYYLPRLPELGAKNTISSIHFELIEAIEIIRRHTSRLPVLDKYTRQLIELSDDHEGNLEDVSKTLHLLKSKMLQLYRGASEKKQMLLDISNACNTIKNKIDEIEKVKIERDLKESQLTKENIFYYTIAILNHPLYKIDYEKELIALPPRIPLLNDFWKWYAIGKRLYDLSLELNKETDIQLSIVEGDEIDKENQLKINSEQYLNNIDHLENTTTWGGNNSVQVTLSQYRERKPLNKQLQKFFSEKVSKVNCIELVRSLEIQVQVSNFIKDEMPATLFENRGPAIRLKRRK